MKKQHWIRVDGYYLPVLWLTKLIIIYVLSQQNKKGRICRKGGIKQVKKIRAVEGKRRGEKVAGIVY